jgi:hypothetical protein
VKSLALVLSTPRERGDWTRVAALAREARARNIEVGLFLMDLGVAFAETPTAAELLADDVEITACGNSYTQYRVAPVAGVTIGSQDDHAALLHRADRVLAFT